MRWSGVAAALAGLALTGCGGLTVEDAAGQYGPPYCKKIQACFPDAFEQNYPGGLSTCEEQWIEGYSNQALGKTAGCNQAQLNVCLSDINALPSAPDCAGSITLEPLPASCDVCYAYSAGGDT